LNAADLSGQWTGTVEMRDAAGATRVASAFLDLEEDGGQVTGTAGPRASEQFEISNGRLEGDKLTFDVQMSQGVIHFRLIFDGKSIKGEARGEGSGGESMVARLDLQRAA
jgi:hypothetical protein